VQQMCRCIVETLSIVINAKHDYKGKVREHLKTTKPAEGNVCVCISQELIEQKGDFGYQLKIRSKIGCFVS